MCVRVLCKITDRILPTEVGVRMPVVDVSASDVAMAYKCCITLTLFLSAKRQVSRSPFREDMMGSDVFRSKRFRQDVVGAKRKLQHPTFTGRQSQARSGSIIGRRFAEGKYKHAHVSPMRGIVEVSKSLHASDIHSCILALPLDCNVAFGTGLHWLPRVLMVSWFSFCNCFRR